MNSSKNAAFAPESIFTKKNTSNALHADKKGGP